MKSLVQQKMGVTTEKKKREGNYADEEDEEKYGKMRRSNGLNAVFYFLVYKAFNILVCNF